MSGRGRSERLNQRQEGRRLSRVRRMSEYASENDVEEEDFESEEEAEDED